VSVTGLGSWRFEGLPEAIEIYQADAAGRVVDFPPLRLGSRVTVP
jgi:hypothetical protein